MPREKQSTIDNISFTLKDGTVMTYCLPGVEFEEAHSFVKALSSLDIHRAADNLLEARSHRQVS